MFEDYTYENLLEDVLDNAPDNVDTRQGSIFYDAVSGILIKIAKLYTDLDLAMELTSLDTATGDALTSKASEYGITRKDATPAKYYVTFEGTTPDVGERFYYDEQYFVLCVDDDGVYYLEAEEAGESGNTIYEGTEAVPVNTIEGLDAATFGTLYEAGADEEDDETLRTRVKEKVAGPAENGNKQHYKTWCESVDGVGLARIYPLWNGPNTVKAVLIGTDGKGCSDELVAQVQEYIDPATLGYTATVGDITYIVGDGLGEGVANLGAHFTAIGAISLTIDVAFTAEAASGYTTDNVQDEAEEAIADYFAELSLKYSDTADIVIRLSSIGSILANLDSVLDYKDLTLNGGTENISPGDDYVPVVGEVTVS